MSNLQESVSEIKYLLTKSLETEDGRHSRELVRHCRVCILLKNREMENFRLQTIREPTSYLILGLPPLPPVLLEISKKV